MSEEKKRSPVVMAALFIIFGLAFGELIRHVDTKHLEKLGICDFGDYIEQKKGE